MKHQLVLAASRRLHHHSPRRKPVSLTRLVANPGHCMHVFATHLLHVLEIGRQEEQTCLA